MSDSSTMPDSSTSEARRRTSTAGPQSGASHQTFHSPPSSVGETLQRRAKHFILDGIGKVFAKAFMKLATVMSIALVCYICNADDIGDVYSSLTDMIQPGEFELMEKYLFVGNPGVGKSMLLNGMIGEEKFRSGISTGSGLTWELQKEEHNGSLYYDTPGLDDIAARLQAGKEITKALKDNGHYKVFFVLTVEGGRLRPADQTTMKIVLDSAHITNYGVVINKVPPNILTKWEKNASDFQTLQALLMSSLPYKASTFHTLAGDPRLEMDNASWKPTKEFLKFVNETTGMKIRRWQVRSINIAGFDAKFDEHKQMMKKFKKDAAEMHRVLKETQSMMKKELVNLKQETLKAEKHLAEKQERLSALGKLNWLQFVFQRFLPIGLIFICVAVGACTLAGAIEDSKKALAEAKAARKAQKEAEAKASGSGSPAKQSSGRCRLL